MISHDFGEIIDTHSIKNQLYLIVKQDVNIQLYCIDVLQLQKTSTIVSKQNINTRLIQDGLNIQTLQLQFQLNDSQKIKQLVPAGQVFWTETQLLFCDSQSLQVIDLETRQMKTFPFMEQSQSVNLLMFIINQHTIGMLQVNPKNQNIVSIYKVNMYGKQLVGRESSSLSLNKQFLPSKQLFVKLQEITLQQGLINFQPISCNYCFVNYEYIYELVENVNLNEDLKEKVSQALLDDQDFEQFIDIFEIITKSRVNRDQFILELIQSIQNNISTQKLISCLQQIISNPNFSKQQESIFINILQNIQLLDQQIDFMQIYNFSQQLIQSPNYHIISNVYKVLVMIQIQLYSTFDYMSSNAQCMINQLLFTAGKLQQQIEEQCSEIQDILQFQLQTSNLLSVNNCVQWWALEMLF
ncbi:Hypothetical_protein [Hexamita inflata]|uniref:Hypothetical_protein n=1 Tax=Hexamita inflata TaxID=28002 RepID=A0AA86NJV4_9EUKA|nr:Hypothetical protein HINF_LOCUS8104 [Hexamita inflata]